MRDYSKVSALFWTGDTGKQLRGHLAAQVVATYLMTCPNSNMIGLYYLPLPTLIHETGIQKQGAMKSLRRLSEGGFAHYEAPSEHVWVVEMARWQIGESLKADDNRVKGIQKELEQYRKCSFFNRFLERYRECFHLHEVRPSEAPSKPETETGAGTEDALVREPDRSYPEDFEKFWQQSSKRGSKYQAWQEWKTVKPSPALTEIINAKMAAFMATPDWQKENGRFAPHVCRWLKRRGWEEEISGAKRKMPDKPIAVC